MLFLRYKKISALFAAFAVVYILQTVLVAPDKATLARYHMSSEGLKALSLTVILPYIIIWIISLIGYLRLLTYTRSISGSKDGVAFQIICRGLLMIVLWFPLSTLINGLGSDYYHIHPGSAADLVRVSNYVTLLLLLPGFWYLQKGSTRLFQLIRTPTYKHYQWTTLVFLGLASLYTYLTLADSVRNHPTASIQTSSYYLPDWLIISTLVVPRIIMWFWGAQAAQNIFLYQRKVKGSLYRVGLRTLAIGLGVVIVSIVVLRGLQSLTAPLSHLNLPLLLLAVYALLILIAVGFVLVARGAKQLQKIEEL